MTSRAPRHGRPQPNLPVQDPGSAGRGGTRPARPILEPPVLVIDPAGLSLIEPDEAEQVVGPDAGEQIGDLRRLPGDLTDPDFRQDYGSLGDYPHLGDGGQERIVEGVVALIVVPVDPDPGDVGWPPATSPG